MARSFRQRVTPPPRALTLSGWVLLPLRAFLGFTFCFAGLQKLANPNFFKTSDPSGIYAQLVASNRISPLHPILGHLLRFSTPIGVIIALGELAVGIGVILGLWTRIAAIAGAIISFTLFLTVSYHASPWYTGADIVFFFAWIPLILAGSGGVLSVDAAVTAMARGGRHRGSGAPVSVPFGLIQRICGHYQGGRCAALGGAACDAGPCPYLRQVDSGAALEPADLSRRRLVLGGAATAAAGVAALVVAGAASGIGRAIGGSKAEPGAVTLAPTTSGPTTTTTAAPGTSTPTSTATTDPPGVAIGAAKEVAVGSWAAFTDPTTHTPSLVIQLAKGRFVAYDAICPHAGCTVGYVPSESIIACPCHGSEFNPDSGDVVQGPATRGLRVLGVAEGADGQLYIEG